MTPRDGWMYLPFISVVWKGEDIYRSSDMFQGPNACFMAWKESSKNGNEIYESSHSRAKWKEEINYKINTEMTITNTQL